MKRYVRYFDLPMSMLKLTLLIVGILVATTGRAQIRESSEFIVGTAQRSMMREVASLTPLPESDLPDHKAVAIADMGGAFKSIIVLGPKNFNARQLALAVQSSVGNHEIVEFSREKEFSAAKWFSSKAKLFSTSSSETVDLAPLIHQLKLLGLDCIPVIRTHRLCQVLSNAAIAADRPKDSVYYLRSSLSTSIQASPRQWILPAFVFLGPPFLTGFGLLLAVFVARNPKMERQKRQSLFKKISSFSGFGVVIPSMPLSMWIIFSGQLYPITDLWLGTRSVSALMPMAALPVLVLIPFALLSAKVEGWLFAIDDVPASRYTPPARKLIQRENGKYKRLRLTVAVLCLVGYLATYLISSKSGAGLRALLTMLFMFGWFFGADMVPTLINRFWGKSKFFADPTQISESPELTLEEQELRRFTNETANKLGVVLRTITIIESKDSRKSVGIVLFKGLLMIPDHSIKELSEGELRFAIAHSLSYGKAQILVPLVLGISFLVVVLVLAIPHYIPFQERLLIQTLVVLGVGVPAMPKIFRWSAGRQVQIALSITCQPQDAESYLARLAAEADPKFRNSRRFIDPWKAYVTIEERKSASRRKS